jgi:hypothetical protein
MEVGQEFHGKAVRRFVVHKNTFCAQNIIWYKP